MVGTGEDARRRRLREAGLKVTAPRLAILAVLEEDRRHPTAEEIHQAIRERRPALSLSTVYKTLESFLRTGLVRRVSGGGNRLRVDGVPGEHDHAVCRLCGAVFDVDRPEAVRAAVPRESVAGMRITGVRIEYDVVCRACEARQGRPQPN
ncbi:MAG: transcriptional repressor [Acidobacteria bacterium]|nr:MAG: transcriptional repressor [Acidobacteriota bacterium]